MKYKVVEFIIAMIVVALLGFLIAKCSASPKSATEASGAEVY